MTIVIPMAGASTRFTNVGMSPKYMLKVKPFVSLFDMSVSSFEKWFDTAKFIIVTRDEYGKQYAEAHMAHLGVKNYQIINLEFLTRGQAESVYLGLKEAKIDNDGDELMIFNIDTIRHNLNLPENDVWDTLFDAFYDENATQEWSFAEVKEGTNDIIKTAEKRKISNWCSTGLYIFRSIWLYKDAYEKAITKKEYNFYIAPLYNQLKGMKNILLPCNKEDVEFAGTPTQYIELQKKYNPE